MDKSEMKTDLDGGKSKIEIIENKLNSIDNRFENLNLQLTGKFSILFKALKSLIDLDKDKEVEKPIIDKELVI
ncbi:MAG: hypothetical protein V4471_05360 [Pseudomonadota bacterium]